jgi:NAD(P)H-hydrate epimerase
MLPLRKDDSHKGDYGRLLIVAGSAGMAGAACLCARSALRSGAGLVYEAGPATIMPVVSVYVPEAIFLTYPGDVGEEDPCRVAAVLVEACHPDGLVIGPGLPAGGKTAALVKALLTALPPQTRLVLDAGALQSLTSTGELAELRQYAGRRSSEQAPILTPHPGEMARLLGCAVADVQRDRMTAAMRLADLTGAVTVLKGSRTLVAMPDGRLCINPTGNPGMATAGAGDVLAGIIGGLAVQGMSAWETAVAGVYLHGLAGDIAARKKGLHGLMAGDLTETLPAAFLNTLNGDEHHEV